MCRLMALRAAHPVPLYRFLIGGDNSFAVQSLEHPDGWGIAYHQGGEPSLVKSVLPAITDELFEEVAFAVTTRSVLAHVRRATAGVIAHRNCHPFRMGPWVFAHNGAITDYDRVKDELVGLLSPAHRSSLEGETDAEVFFRLFLTHLEALADLGDPTPRTAALAAALGRTLSAIRRVADPAPGAGTSAGEPSSLTCIASTGAVTVGVASGRRLSVRQSEDAQGSRQVMFSSEAISTPRIIMERFPWRELVHDEYLVIGPELSIESGPL